MAEKTCENCACNNVCNHDLFGFENCGNFISIADVEAVRHGRWEKTEDDYCGLNIIRCSLCREEWCFEIDDDVKALNYNYCPNCGAEMDGERKDGDGNDG